MGFDNFASVFQTEVLAISFCAATILSKNPKGQKFSIFSDSQAAIAALDDPLTNSKIVLKCKNNLNRLGTKNKVEIFWIPGHSVLGGNEVADSLANAGSASNVYGPSPYIPIGWFESISAVKRWRKKLFHNYWRDQTSLEQSKRLINPSLHSKISLVNRSDLKLFVGYMTGQHTKRHHLHRIGVTDESFCKLCGAESETTFHILLNCSGLQVLTGGGGPTHCLVLVTTTLGCIVQ